MMSTGGQDIVPNLQQEVSSLSTEVERRAMWETDTGIFSSVGERQGASHPCKRNRNGHMGTKKRSMEAIEKRACVALPGL